MTRNNAQEGNETNIRWVSLAILILAGTGLAYQVALTRIFSLIFQYHFVFLVVSLAILGLGIGAALGYMARQLNIIGDLDSGIQRSAIALAVSFPITAFLLSTISSINLIVFTAAVALIPFLLIGWINALVYGRFAGHSHRIYGADLIGAALGLLAAPVLLMILGPFGLTLGLGIFAATAALMLSMRRSYPVITIIALLILATIGNRITDTITYQPTNIFNAPPDKTMVHILNDPSQNASVLATEWGPFAQVDVVETNDDAARFVFTDAGAGSIMLRYSSDTDPLDFAWLRSEVAFIPFEVSEIERTLLIGSGAGYDIVQAKYAGSNDITAVEINPAIVKVTRAYDEYNGGVLDLPGVKTVVTDGRNFVDRTDNLFDLIYLNFVYSQAARPGNSALAENYAFTTEALNTYYDRLSEDGQIGFVTHTGIHGVRLLMTTLEILQERDLSVPDALQHTALVRTANPVDPSLSPSVLMISRQAWTEEDAQSFIQVAERHGMEALYVPHLFEESLAVLANETMTLDEYLSANTDFDITPTTDNQPFFYHLTGGLPEPLDGLLLVSLILTSGYLIIVSALQPEKPRHEWTRISLVIVFALLGVGFLLAEVALLQYFRLLLGDPVLSFSAGLGALLLGGGAGSRFGRRFQKAQLSRVIILASLGVGIWLILATFIYPIVVNIALPFPVLLRVVVTILGLLPLGFLLGLPFPSALRIADEVDNSAVPLLWGMNAIASTLGAVLATIIALIAGFQLALWLGALLYIAVAGLAHFVWRRTVVI